MGTTGTDRSRLGWIAKGIVYILMGGTALSIARHTSGGDDDASPKGSLDQVLEDFPDADPNDGVIDVAVLTPDTWRDRVVVPTNLVRNRPQPDRLVDRERGQSIVVRLDRLTPWELDGEDRPPTARLDIGIQPNALEVRC